MVLFISNNIIIIIAISATIIATLVTYNWHLTDQELGCLYDCLCVYSLKWATWVVTGSEGWVGGVKSNKF